MLIGFLLFLIALGVLFLMGIRQYGAGKPECGEGFNRCGKLLPMGLLLIGWVKRSYSGYYDRKLMMALGEVCEAGKALENLKVYWANKLVLLLLAVLSCLFLGIFIPPDTGYGVFCATLMVCIAWLPDRELRERVKKRRLALRKDFPDFVNKLVLLINAGMTVQKAWEKSAAGSATDSPLYRELQTVLVDIRAGVPEYRAYEEFAKRCRIPEITRFVSVILQNLRKGNAELVPVLRMFSMECWEMRKNLAKKYGEEASTKMLFPMMLMFVAILLIVGTPAVLSLQGLG